MPAMAHRLKIADLILGNGMILDSGINDVKLSNSTYPSKSNLLQTAQK